MRRSPSEVLEIARGRKRVALEPPSFELQVLSWIMRQVEVSIVLRIRKKRARRRRSR